MPLNQLTHIVVWCDSAQGLISTPVDKDGMPVLFSPNTLPPEVIKTNDPLTIFAILKDRDGTKIAIPFKAVFILFGWEF